jgi:two-component system, NarL family, nitrate/nitrite response regulator NarL
MHADVERSPLRVLLVDDDEVFRSMLAALLEHGGGPFEVVATAGNGAEAIGLAAAFRPDVVVMDADLPVLDGLEAARLIRLQDPTTPIVLVSGSDFSDRASEAVGALDVGALAYIPKTQVADQLEQTLLSLDRMAAPVAAG